MTKIVERKLPEGASALIALARVAHHDGDRQLERSVMDRLARDYGIQVNFTCEQSVERDLRRTEVDDQLDTEVQAAIDGISDELPECIADFVDGVREANRA